MSNSFRTFKVHLWSFSGYLFAIYTVKPVLSDHSKEDQQLVCKTDNHLIQVKSIAECSKHSAIFSTYLKLPSVFKTFLSFICEWPLLTGFTILSIECNMGKLMWFWYLLLCAINVPMSSYAAVSSGSDVLILTRTSSTSILCV